LKSPSIEWRERVAPDEDGRFQRYGEQFVDFQKRRDQRYGTGRALHRKQIAGLSARLDVAEQVVEQARHGLFATPGAHDAWIRMSNATMNVRRDSEPDVRGFAIKVFGVDGPGALGTGPTSSQDFALVNVPGFTSGNAAHFAGLIIALSNGRNAAFRYLLRAYGPIGAIRAARRGTALLNTPFTGFATEPFFSAAAVCVGPYAARVRVLPRQRTALPTDPADWAADIRRHLEAGEVSYDLQLQFFTAEATTPIENAAAVWPESESPYHTVARLTIPQQDLESDAGQALSKKIEASVFDPWNALMEHRPLGDIMRARKVVYLSSERSRGAV
jgi:catalase